jgi:hypothetical protein
MTSQTKVKIGDLVNHLLMAKEWLGVVSKIQEFELDEKKVWKALICIISPHHFSKWHSVAPSSAGLNKEKVGWVDLDFLKVVSGVK